MHFHLLKLVDGQTCSHYFLLNLLLETRYPDFLRTKIVNPTDKFSCQALKLALQVDCMILGWIQSTDWGAISSGSRNYNTVANHLFEDIPCIIEAYLRPVIAMQIVGTHTCYEV